ncbi:MAG: BatD family protein, partial [Chromatiaceae bacterium]
MRATAFDVRRFGLIILGLVLCGRVAAAGLDASLDRNRLAEGDTVTLNLTAPGDAAGTPDFSPLKSDFDILDQGQSTRMTIVNGRSSSTREWRLVLAPKRTGRLTVPSLSVGGLSSAPLALEVVPASQAARLGQSRPIMLEVAADPKAPYVQGQVVYTVRILHRVPLRQASLSDPSAGDAIVQKLGEDKTYSTYRNGELYQVIERRYAVFPQHSGTLTIDAPVLSASVPEQGRRGPRLRDRMFGGEPFRDFQHFFGGDPFAGMDSMFEETRPVQVRGRRLSLDVKPQPAAAPSPWLPAESLQLSETWSPDPPVFRVGEPVTRTIAITGQGVSASQLPDLAPSVPSGIKVYPDKAQAQTRAEGDDLVAMKVIKLALVPTAPGKLTLPEVRLPWWDTQTNQERVAVLPARTLDVLPARAGA